MIFYPSLLQESLLLQRGLFLLLHSASLLKVQVLKPHHLLTGFSPWSLSLLSVNSALLSGDFPKTQLLDVTSAQQLWWLLFAFLSKLHSLVNIFFFFFWLFAFLATLCGIWDLSSPTRDQTCIPCSESEAS